MKAIVIKILQGLFSTPQFAIKVKDAALSSKSEHLVRTINYIDRKQLNLFGKTIIDIGAIAGETSVYFAQLYPAHDILAFEPLKASYEKAKRQTAAYPKIRLFNLALSDKNGHAPPNADKNSQTSILPETKNKENTSEEAGKPARDNRQALGIATLDGVYTDMQPVLLMKADTGGTELHVLKGARHTLVMTKLVLVELGNPEPGEGGSPYYEVDAFLRSLNFKLCDLFVSHRQTGDLRSFNALYENTEL